MRKNKWIKIRISNKINEYALNYNEGWERKIFDNKKVGCLVKVEYLAHCLCLNVRIDGASKIFSKDSLLQSEKFFLSDFKVQAAPPICQLHKA